jgi:CYTH domain-containing protein
LRYQLDDDGSGRFKLTQKIPLPGIGAQQGFLTTMYLNEEEFRILAELPAKKLKKTRYSIPPFGIDLFEDSLAGLILAEAEFESVAEAESLVLPPFILHEVSGDVRFTGGQLAHASRKDVQDWLSEYGVKFSGPS